MRLAARLVERADPLPSTLLATIALVSAGCADARRPPDVAESPSAGLAALPRAAGRVALPAPDVALFVRDLPCGRTIDVSFMADRSRRSRFSVRTRCGGRGWTVLADVVHEGGPAQAEWIAHRLKLPGRPGTREPSIFEARPQGRLATLVRWLGLARGRSAGRISEPLALPPVLGRSLDPRPSRIVVVQGPLTDAPSRAGTPGPVADARRAHGSNEGAGSALRGPRVALSVSSSSADCATRGYDACYAVAGAAAAERAAAALLDLFGSRGPWLLTLALGRPVATAPAPGSQEENRVTAAALLESLRERIARAGLEAQTEIVAGTPPSPRACGGGRRPPATSRGADVTPARAPGHRRHNAGSGARR